MKDLPASEQPYEKFLSKGVEALSDAELLSIIIKTGTKNVSSVDIAKEVLSGRHGNLLNLYELSYEDFLAIEGIGTIKAIQLIAIAELSKRISTTRKGYSVRMNSPQSVADYYMEQLRHNKEELVIVALFDAKSCFIGDAVVSKGSLNCAYVIPADIFRIVLIRGASSFILLHNHPSGNSEPSRDDHAMTKRICEATKIIGMNFVDHIVIGDKEYYSFNEQHII